jgi:NAD(P)-dependent dehydrogenase (short-subunit alcohol dehydrogenase family)
MALAGGLLRFDGDVVIVTGAGSGLGRAYALELARRGARVVVNDLGGDVRGSGLSSPEPATAVAEQINLLGGEAISNFETVSTPAGGGAIVRAALDAWGRVDAVVANAGIFRGGTFEEATADDFATMLDVHLLGAAYVVQAAYGVMKRQGGGRIVLTTSSAGMVGMSGGSVYACAKAAVIGLMRSIAHEGRPHHILANAIAPSAFGTRLSSADTQNLPGASWCTPERVSPMVVALAHRSCPATGELFCAWGGLYFRSWYMAGRGWVSAEGDIRAEDLTAHWSAITDPWGASEPIGDGHDWVFTTIEDVLGALREPGTS